MEDKRGIIRILQKCLTHAISERAGKILGEGEFANSKVSLGNASKTQIAKNKIPTTESISRTFPIPTAI